VIAGTLLGIISALLANELCELGPWCARKIVRWSAFRRYANADRAEMRAEEWTAVVNDRPGTMFKLITAVSFAINAVIVSGIRVVARESDDGRQPGMGLSGWRLDLDRALATSSARAADVSEAVGSDDFANAVTYAHNLAMASDRAHNLGRAIYRARNIAFGNGLFGLTRRLNQALDSAYALGRELDRTNDRFSDLRIGNLDLTLRLGRSRGHELDLRRAHARDLARELDLGYAPRFVTSLVTSSVNSPANLTRPASAWLGLER
jgi:hypothetical protein